MLGGTKKAKRLIKENVDGKYDDINRFRKICLHATLFSHFNLLFSLLLINGF